MNFEIPVDEAERNIPDFPDHTGYAIKEENLITRYGEDRYRLIVNSDEYKQYKYRALSDIPNEFRRFIPQDDLRWLEMREVAQLTGSVSAELAGFHDVTAANILGLPKMMHRNPMEKPYNDKWEDLRVRIKYGKLPRIPMDPPGNVHCAQGKVKEANGLSYMMDSIPKMVFREMGAIEITEDQLRHFELYNPLKNGERILKFPQGFKIVISPDGDITVPESCTEDGNGGHVFSDKLTEMALEIKFPTFFREKNNSDFPGFDFFPLGRNCKIYDHPKTYYLPQVFLEMLALKRSAALFGCATYAGGMRIWKIDMDTKYLSGLLSLYIHIYEKFMLKDQKVPTNYIFEKYSVDTYHRRFYKELVELTLEKSNNAPLYMFISGENTQRITQDIGMLSNNVYVKFPKLPEDVVPKYQLLCIYGRRLLHKFKDILWTSAYTQFQMRKDNINLLADTELTYFSFHILKDIYTNVYNCYCGNYDDKSKEELKKLSVIENKILESMEHFLLSVYKFIFELYGSPPFGMQYTLDVVDFHRAIVNAALALNSKYGLSAGSNGMFVFGEDWIKRLISAGGDSCWTDNFDVSSVNVYKEIVEGVFEESIKQPESLKVPHMWQYQRLIAVLMFMK